MSVIRGIAPELDAAIAKAFERPGMLVAMTDRENLDILQSTPGAVGFTSLTQVMVRRPALKIIDIDGVSPLASATVNRDYPYLKHLYLVVPSQPSPGALRFLEFIRTREGQRILQASGAVPVRINGEVP